MLTPLALFISFEEIDKHILFHKIKYMDIGK